MAPFDQFPKGGPESTVPDSVDPGKVEHQEVNERTCHSY